MSRSPDDESIIELYWARDDRAIAETDRKYKSYLLSVAKNILSDRLDCEECLNDTYLGVWNSIPPTRPTSLKAFLTVIMRRACVNRYHSRHKQSAVPSEMTLSLSELDGTVIGGGTDDAFDAAELARVISDFVCSLPERRRFIFMSRYYASEPVDAIAADLGVSRSTVAKELAAIRSSLKEKLESEGYSL